MPKILSQKKGFNFLLPPKRSNFANIFTRATFEEKKAVCEQTWKV